MEKESKKKWFDFDLFNQVPSIIAIIDKQYNVVDANNMFHQTFGPWEGKKCYEVYKKSKTKCRSCFASKTFSDGVVRVSEEQGRDLMGNMNHYLVHMSPYKDEKGRITHVIEMSTDISDRVRIENEYMTIFDNVPCFITVIDRNYRVKKSNKYFQKKFGSKIGTYCYESYKKREMVCEECTANKVFENGKTYYSLQEGYDVKGNMVYYMVTATPYSKTDGRVDFVIEMAVDITETVMLENRLKEMLEFQQTIIQNALDGIIASDDKGIVNIYNPSAKNKLKYPRSKIIGKMHESSIYPEDFLRTINKKSLVILQESEITDYNGKSVPIVCSGIKLKKGEKDLGKVMFFQDMSQMKQLESDVLDAERLAAVGQTVAGLAHGIKNILMGLEGGMYVVNSGLKRGNNELVSQGWDMLTNNIEKITSFTKEFLSFARGTTVEVSLVKPQTIAYDTIELFKDTIKQAGIILVTKIDKKIDLAPMDSNEIHTCLANLVSNAIDACQMSENQNPKIEILLYEKNNTIYFEVKDNGVGIDYEVKKRIFTSFFSTKDSGRGTGLGLLTTRKIVSSHGGKVHFSSIIGKGSMFRLEFPRNRLPVPRDEEKD